MTTTPLKEAAFFAAANPIVEAIRHEVDMMGKKDGSKWSTINGVEANSVMEQAQNFYIAKHENRNALEAINKFAISSETFWKRINSVDSLRIGNEKELQIIESFTEDLKNIPNESINVFTSGLVTKAYFERAVDLQQKLQRMQSSLYNLNGQIEVLSEKSDQAINASSIAASSVNEKLEAGINILIKPVEDKAKELSEKYDEIIISLSQKNDQINSLISTATGKAMALSHLQDAENQRLAADKFRQLTIGYTLSITFISTIALVDLWSHPFDVSLLISRIAFLVFLSLPSAYLAREANKHRIQENLSKKTALDLVAIDPYIQGMEKKEMNKIKSELATRIFFANSPTLETDQSQNDLLKIATALLDKVYKR